MLELQSKILQRAGYKPLPTCDSQLALKLAYRYKPTLAVINDALSGVGGDQLCHHIKHDPILRRTRIVVVSTGDCVRDRSFQSRTGADAVLAIPFLPAELLDVINALPLPLPATSQLVS